MHARLLLCLALLFSVLRGQAQDDSPYARFGYEGKVLRTAQERQQRLMLLVPNPDTTATVAKVGLDPAKQRYYLFDKQNQVLQMDTLAATTVARFLSIDPLSPKYPWYTPYQFAGNKPIQFVDIDGLEEGYDLRLRQMERGYLKGTVTAKELKEFHQANGVAAIVGLGTVGAVLGGEFFGPAALRYGTGVLSYFMTNPRAVQTATEIGVGVTAGVVGYDGADLPGPYDDAARAARPGFSKVNIALGHGMTQLKSGRWLEVLPTFSELVGAPFHKQWKGLGLYQTADSFVDMFRQVTNKVIQTQGTIHFNLDDIRDIDGFLTKYKPGTQISEDFSYTQWELLEVLSNPKLLERTQFWRNTDPVKTTEVLKQVGKKK